jgi:hypothetical protein
MQHDPKGGAMKRVILAALVVLGCIFVGAASAAGPIVNGDFETGDLTGWTPFTTPDGTSQGVIVTRVRIFGDQLSYAVQFRVGRTVCPCSISAPYEGGGVYQNVNAAGLFNASADIAALNIGPSTLECGRFDLLVDGVVVATHTFGFCPFYLLSDGPAQLTLTATGLALSPGSHEIRIQVTRPFFTAPDLFDSDVLQFVDNVSLTQILPTSKDQCMSGGWQSYVVFKNQGDCVSFVATGGQNQPAG